MQYSDTSVNEWGELQEIGSLLDRGQVAGYGLIWNKKNLHDEINIKGNCSKSIREYGPEAGGSYQIKFLNQHDTKDPLCLFEELKEDEQGLYFRTKPLDEWEIPGTSAYRLLLQLRNKTINNFSTGWNYVWDKTEYDEELDAIMLKEIRLFEISAVSIPSALDTYVIRSAEEEEFLVDEIESFVKTLPRAYQLQARQLFARQKSLTTIKPPEQQQRDTALETGEPAQVEQVRKSITNYIIENLNK